MTVSWDYLPIRACYTTSPQQLAALRVIRQWVVWAGSCTQVGRQVVLGGMPDVGAEARAPAPGPTALPWTQASPMERKWAGNDGGRQGTMYIQTC